MVIALKSICTHLIPTLTLKQTQVFVLCFLVVVLYYFPISSDKRCTLSEVENL